MNPSVGNYPLIAIVGPTAAGKSALALALAERLNGEVVNYDSVQLYRGFDVGSGKLPLRGAARRRAPSAGLPGTGRRFHRGRLPP